MTSPNQLLLTVWREVINASMSGEWIDATLNEAASNPDAPFADVAGVVERLLALGATREELSRIVRWASFEASFILLDMLRDPSIDKSDYEQLQQSLLEADPSGREGRPGSWPL